MLVQAAATIVLAALYSQQRTFGMHGAVPWTPHEAQTMLRASLSPFDDVDSDTSAAVTTLGDWIAAHRPHRLGSRRREELGSDGGREEAQKYVTVHALLLAMRCPSSWLGTCALAPGQLKDRYLPTMPSDELSMILGAVDGTRWYKCPKGHPYSVGECGMPMQTSVCMTCGGE